MKFINSQLASQAYLINKFTNIKRKLLKTNANIYFNRTCNSKNLIPKYINVKSNTKTKNAQQAVCTAQRSWLNNEIKFLYKKKAYLNETLYKTHLHVTKKSLKRVGLILRLIYTTGYKLK